MEPGILERCDRRTGAGWSRSAARSSRRRSECRPSACGKRGWCGVHVLVSANLSPLITDPLAPRADEARSAVGDRQRPSQVTGPQFSQAVGRAHGLLHQASRRCSIASTCSPSRLPRCGRSRRRERWPQRIGDREMDTYHRWMEVTSYATFAGLPAISVPVGFDERGLADGHAADRPSARRRRPAALARSTRRRWIDRWMRRPGSCRALGMTRCRRGDVLRQHVSQRGNTDRWSGRHGDDRAVLQRSTQPFVVPPADFDEVWHFYGGDPMRLVLLHPDGSTR